jgi:hypothetical protein
VLRPGPPPPCDWQPAISRHLKGLEDAGLIRTHVHGTARAHRLNPVTMGQLRHWLGQYRALWEAQVQRIDAALDSMDDRPEGPKP